MCVCVFVSEQIAQLQQTVQELQKVLDLTVRAREEDRRVQQQEVEERDALIENITSENQRLHHVLQVSLHRCLSLPPSLCPPTHTIMLLCLQEQEEALKKLDKRIEEVQTEREKETEVKRVFTNELKHRREEEEKRRAKEKEVRNIKSRML